MTMPLTQLHQIDDTPIAYLDVRKSLNNAKWVLPPVDEVTVSRMIQSHGMPDFIARMLCLRGVDVDTVQSFLHPTLKSHFPDPFSLKSMDEFANDTAKKIMDGHKFGVLADFDVDGGTSAAILIKFFRHCGVEPAVYIPDRLTQGYGPNVEALESLKKDGAQTIVMADCGTTSFEVVQAARDLGIDVAIFDHHEAEEKLPNANYVINPKRKDDSSGLDMLAACGVCFLACVAVNKILRSEGFFDQKGIDEAPLKNWMDLVALGTVCDMVPMTGPNRLFVRAGFVQMAMKSNNGIRALCEVAGLETIPTPMDAGFTIGPRINAGSRVHKSHLGALLLSTEDLDEARSIAFVLDDCNEQRKKIQSQMMKEALERVERGGHDNLPVIIVSDETWHPGLSGLVAGRLKDKFGKPAIVVTYAKIADGTVEGRGSGRSILGVNLADAFIGARNEGIIVKGGGHAMAGGFTVMPDRLKDFENFLIENISAQMKNIDVTQQLRIDGIASVQGAKPNFVKLLVDNIGPFGQQNLEPVFALSNVRVHMADVLKEKHIRVQVSDWEGGGRMKAMLFYGVGTPLGEALLKGRDKAFHLAGQFKINSWQGRESVEFMLSDGVIVE